MWTPALPLMLEVCSTLACQFHYAQLDILLPSHCSLLQYRPHRFDLLGSQVVNNLTCLGWDFPMSGSLQGSVEVLPRDWPKLSEARQYT